MFYGLSPCRKIKTFCIVQNMKQKTVWKQDDTINTKQGHHWHRNVLSVEQTWSHIYFQGKEERKINKILSVNGNKIHWMHIK